MAITDPSAQQRRRFPLTWLVPVLLLTYVYGLLGLTGVSHVGDVMDRCVLMDPKLSRIWSVAHCEIGVSYLGVFVGMAYYLLRASKVESAHLKDMGIAFAYLLGSFLLDFVCVRYFTPFIALLIGDAIVMTFTLIVSRQLWFQRLLGIFVPLVFFTCALGHMMEGMSYWKLTYPVNVPWTMVTADIGFAILVNAARFPAFIRGQDIINEMNETRADAQQQYAFVRDVLLSVTEHRLHLCAGPDDLPPALPEFGSPVPLTRETLAALRRHAAKAAQELGLPDAETHDLITAVGEGAMNAVVHGGGGMGVVRTDSRCVQVWIMDQGSGIHFSQLPRATLELGYSTKDSLGHGFWLMLRTVERADLLTSNRGTTLVLTQCRGSLENAA